LKDVLKMALEEGGRSEAQIWEEMAISWRDEAARDRIWLRLSETRQLAEKLLRDVRDRRT
jgi:hypothetical protein